MATFFLPVPVDATCSCHFSCVGDVHFVHLWNKWLRQKYQLLFQVGNNSLIPPYEYTTAGGGTGTKCTCTGVS